MADPGNRAQRGFIIVPPTCNGSGVSVPWWESVRDYWRVVLILVLVVLVAHGYPLPPAA